jgi:photosystem II stability/assembly factor-like uncharacterized protein
MKKLSFLLVFYYSLFITNYSLSQWLWVNPKPHGNDINSVCFVNNNTGWMFGGSTQSYKTTNKGINWIYCDFTGSPTIYISKLFNFDTQNSAFWLGGDGGRLYKSIDSGKTFQLIILPTTNTVKNIFFLNKNTGYVAASQLYKTTNSGLNWVVNFNPGSEIFCPFFLNDSIGWCASTTYSFSSNYGSEWYNGKYKTTNSGNNWEQISFNTYTYNVWAKDIYFKDTTTGIFSGTNFLFKSNNGGRSWIYVDTGGVIDKGPGNNFLWGGDNDLYKSTNYGTNWSFVSEINIPQTCIKYVDSITYFIGGKYGNLMKSTNGGLNWSNYLKSFTSLEFNNIISIDSNNIFVVSNNVILKTTNSGANFLNLDSNIISQYPINSICFLNNSSGWIGSDYGYILRTTNGGFNWAVQKCDTSKIKSVHFLYSGIGYFVTLSKKIYKSSNFGANWNYISTLSGYQDIVSLQFLNENTGFLLTSYYLFKTTSGGQQWSTLYSYGVSFEFMKFINANTGYIIYSVWPPYDIPHRLLSRTTNGGHNWSDRIDNQSLRSFYCVDSNIVYAGGKGILFKSTNSGNNWEQEQVSTSYINGISSYKKNLWLTGEMGMIIKGVGKVPVYINSDNEEIIEDYKLFQNFPNPFNPTTNIRYQIPNNSHVILKVYDILGKEIATLVNDKLKPGEYETTFDGTAFPSGVYFYKLQSGDFSETKKMLMIK